MAKADHIKALVQSHADGDDTRFYSIAMQVAAQAARQGQSRFAEDLRKLVDEAKSKANLAADPRRPIPLARPRGELAGLLVVAYPKTRLSHMALNSEIRGRVERVLAEQTKREVIRQHGLSPQRKLLLVGPPGTGKTMTASAIAGELGLPIFSIQLHALLTKYMGETAAKLRVIFDAIEQTRGVYLFDEFDAVGGHRAASNDVGEIRRVLNSFLTFLESDHSASVVVCATNHPALLDRALFRRFDAVIEYELPDWDMAYEVMRARLSVVRTENVAWNSIAEATRGLSHSDIARACEQAIKDALISERTAVTTEDLLLALRDRRMKVPD